jgi:hypothetical protein
MGNVVGYSLRNTSSNPSVGSGSGGGDVEDILKRLSNVETYVFELRSQVSAIAAVIPHLATKADIKDVHLATKADIKDAHLAMKADIGEVKTDLAAMETKIIKWIIATVLSSSALVSALAFTIAKFVH